MTTKFFLWNRPPWRFFCDGLKHFNNLLTRKMFLGSYQGRGIIHLSEQPERIKTHRKSRNSKQMSVFTRTLIKMIVFPSKTMFYDNVDRFALIFSQNTLNLFLPKFSPSDCDPRRCAFATTFAAATLRITRFRNSWTFFVSFLSDLWSILHWKMCAERARQAFKIPENILSNPFFFFHEKQNNLHWLTDWPSVTRAIKVPINYFAFNEPT